MTVSEVESSSLQSKCVGHKDDAGSLPQKTICKYLCSCYAQPLNRPPRPYALPVRSANQLAQLLPFLFDLMPSLDLHLHRASSLHRSLAAQVGFGRIKGRYTPNPRQNALVPRVSAQCSSAETAAPPSPPPTSSWLRGPQSPLLGTSNHISRLLNTRSASQTGLDATSLLVGDQPYAQSLAGGHSPRLVDSIAWSCDPAAPRRLLGVHARVHF